VHENYVNSYLLPLYHARETLLFIMVGTMF
jgi:hypothetical protein